MNSLINLRKWFEGKKAQIQEDYFQFLRFRSISTDSTYSKEMKSCAEWLRGYIAKNTLLKTELIETEGYPLVYGEDLRAGPGAPTLLIYGHYDVQPVDPIELWESDPFEPKLRHGNIYARGAVDDKGQIFYAILAVQAWKELDRQLPINLKFCIEGEEESASIGLSRALPSIKGKLKADSILVVDFGAFDEETAAVSLGARGIIGLELTLRGSNGDLHSGMHGGIAYNPNRALAELLSQIWDEKGRVRVEGFYDDVVEMSPEEKGKYDFRFENESYSKEFGIEAFGGEKDRSPGENVTLRPTVEINGMVGGYTGKGMKTVIPAEASAKITCRLVPNQDPKKISRQLAAFFRKHVVKGMKLDLIEHGGEEAFRGNPDCPLAKAVSMASEEVTGRPCKNVLSGGSIPIINAMMKSLEAEVVGTGYGLDGDNIHAPNEYFDMTRFEKGFLTIARTLEIL